MRIHAKQITTSQLKRVSLLRESPGTAVTQRSSLDPVPPSSVRSAWVGPVLWLCSLYCVLSFKLHQFSILIFHCTESYWLQKGCFLVQDKQKQYKLWFMETVANYLTKQIVFFSWVKNVKEALRLIEFVASYWKVAEIMEKKFWASDCICINLLFRIAPFRSGPGPPKCDLGTVWKQGHRSACVVLFSTALMGAQNNLTSLGCHIGSSSWETSPRLLSFPVIQRGWWPFSKA